MANEGPSESLSGTDNWQYEISTVLQAGESTDPVQIIQKRHKNSTGAVYTYMWKEARPLGHMCTSIVDRFEWELYRGLAICIYVYT